MKRKINWAIPGLLAMIAVIAGLALVQSLSATSPDPVKLVTQCSACHSMDDHVTSWKASSHKDVSCTDCHADPGVRGWIEMQLGQLRMLSRSRDPHFDIAKVATSVPNERCINCHAREMPWVMQDLKPPKFDENGQPLRVEPNQLKHFAALAGHDLHLTLEKPLLCVSCHSGTSHGPADRKDKVEQWHKTCLECHTEQKVAMAVRTSISCSACHADLALISPEDHKKTNFRDLHGKSAATDVQSCQQCHLTPGLVQVKPGQQAPAATFLTISQSKPHPLIPAMPAGSVTVAEGMKDNCAACHGITMPHPKNWVTQHTKGFAETPQLCATCHGTRDQGFNVKVMGNPREIATTDATCTSCHAQPMPHPANWVGGGHTSAAQSAPQTCAQCHSSGNQVSATAPHASPQFCLDCHLSKYFHPRGYTVTHKYHNPLAPNGVDVAANCAQCHTPTQNSCTDCHTAGFGKGVKQQWHPAGFISAHKAFALAPNGRDVAVSCTKCHTPTENSCTSCHTAGFGPGVKQQWHPANFWISHAQTTTPANAVSCKNCHNYVEPSCSACHRNY